MPNAPHVTAVTPGCAIEGGRIVIHGRDFSADGAGFPVVHVGDTRARVVSASSTRLGVQIPQGVSTPGGRLPVRIDGVPGDAAFVEVPVPLATGLHQVDSPVFDSDGNLYVTFSGTRGQQAPVSIFRVRPNGARETFSSGVVNPTSMAIDRLGRLYVSSRFEGTVYRMNPDGSAAPFATDLGTACGLAFAPDGTLFVGDRSGTIFTVNPMGHATPFASIPPSIAAFHLALAPDGTLYITGATLASHDAVYVVSPGGSVSERPERFGRPQGLAIGPAGSLLVVEALAGASGLYRLADDRPPEQLVAAPGLVGVACAPDGGVVVTSSDTAYRISPIF